MDGCQESPRARPRCGGSVAGCLGRACRDLASDPLGVGVRPEVAPTRYRSAHRGGGWFGARPRPRIEFHEVLVDRGRPIRVPNVLPSLPHVLPSLPLDRAFATVGLPLHLNWSDRGRHYDLRDRCQRARVYALVLREGGPEDVLAYVDGALLVDLWDELVLSVKVRAAWAGVVTGRRGEEVS